MGDLSTLQSFLTNIISPESLSNLSSQMTSSGTASLSRTATLSLTSSNLKYLTGNTLDGTNLNKLHNLKNISITGLKNYLSGTDMPKITLSGLSTLDFSDNGMRITQEALSSLSTVCVTPTTCNLSGSNCTVSDLTSNTLTPNLTVCPSTNGDYDDLKTLLGSILDEVSMETFKTVNWDNKLQTNISLSNMSVSSLSITSGIKFTNLSIFDISQNDLTITQPEVNSLTDLCDGDSPTKCTLFGTTQTTNNNNCSLAKLTSTIPNLIANQHTCPTPVPQQPTNGDYTNLTKLLEGILSQEEILTFKNTLINQINSYTSKTNLSLSNMSVLSLSKLTSGIKLSNLSIFDISQNKLTITQSEVNSLTTLCDGDNTICTLFGTTQTTNTNCSSSSLTSTNIPSLIANQRTCSTTPPSIPTLGSPQITGLRIIDGGITLDYIRGFDCTPSTTSSLPEFFKEPMIGYWYYAYATDVSNIKDLKPIALKMFNSDSVENTYFNLASGAVVTPTVIPLSTHPAKYGNGVLGSSITQGDKPIFQPYPPSAPSAPKTSKYKVLNIGGWGNWDPNQPVYWTVDSISQILQNIDAIITYMIDTKNNYNVLSIDIEGIHIGNDSDDSQLFGEAVTKICNALYTKELGCMITMPGNGVTKTDPPGKSGMEWFKYVDEQYVTRICLMYYAKINDTETQFTSIYDDIRVPFENSLMNCYPREKLILGVSCATEDCNIGKREKSESLFENEWVQNTFKGGLSMWSKYYGKDGFDKSNFKFRDPFTNAPKFKPSTTPTPPSPTPPTPTPPAGQPTPAPGQPTPAPGQPTPAPGQPTPAPPTPVVKMCLTIPKLGNCSDESTKNGIDTKYCTSNCKNCETIGGRTCTNPWPTDKLYIDSTSTTPTCPSDCK